MTNEEYLDFVRKTFEDMHALITIKNNDYTADRGPFYNFETAEAFGIDPMVGLMLRMGDKFRRLEAYALKGSVQGESVEDAFKDLIGYSCIALGMLESKRDAQEKLEVAEILEDMDRKISVKSAKFVNASDFTEEEIEALTKEWERVKHDRD